MKKKRINHSIFTTIAFLIFIVFIGCNNAPLGDGILTPNSNTIVTIDAYSNIMATNCSTCIGVTKNEDDGSYIGSFDDGDRLVFENVDFGIYSDTATHIAMVVGADVGNGGGQIEVRIVNISQPVTTLTIRTNDAQGEVNFFTSTNEFPVRLYGLHDVWLVSRGKPKNLSSFTFIKSNTNTNI